ncbi:MAG: hypothetical protein JEY79_11225 [Pseudodesulfovibrio sp.]|nr:hypothetical protein [Pseudodesulfovibrio sp.]
MNETVICTTCKKVLRFGQLRSIRPGGKADNILVCPYCHGDSFDVSHLQPGRKAA